jgi:hypothetical protein
MSETISPASADPGGGGRESLTERDRGPGPRGCELDDAKARHRGDVVVQAPTRPLVELLGSGDVGHRDDLDLELHVDRPDARVAVRGASFGGAHRYLLMYGRPGSISVVVSTSSVLCGAANRARRNLKPRPPMSDLFGVKGRIWLSDQPLPPHEREMVDACLRHLDFLDVELKQLDTAIAQRVLESEQMQRLL